MDKRIASAVRQAALFGMLGALTFVAKFTMAGLPNIEPVSLLVMLFAVTLGKKSLFPLYIYVFLELALNGVGIWSIAYLYVWLPLALSARLLRRMNNPVGWAILSGTFGLFFGALCTPICLFAGGPAFALSWWLSGIPFDLLHCCGNFFLALVLFVPLRHLLSRLLSHPS